MSKKEYDAYSLFCKSLDTMGSALEFGSSLARAAARANEQMVQPWEFPASAGKEQKSTERNDDLSVPPPPDAIETARQAVDQALRAMKAAVVTADEIDQPLAETSAPKVHDEAADPQTAKPTRRRKDSQPRAKAAPPVRDPAPEKQPEPAVTARQADQLDERAQRLLARFVAPDPDFFEKSPFEGWDGFGPPAKTGRQS
ncbi:MAG: hypothetical protein AAFX52_06470 [Pseudomonadota bacterium]